MYLILLPIMAITFVLMIVEMQYRRTYGYGRSIVHGMSWPAKQILKGYHSLPEDNRPHANIIHILTTLDERHGSEETSAHFTRYGYEGGKNRSMRLCNCNNSYSPQNCPYQAYKDMYHGVNNIKTNIAMREKAVLESKTNFIDDDVKNFKEDLKRESVLLEQQRRELSA